ncbi:MAG: HD domain-containing protein [Endomicrobiia bacterium]
MEPTSLYKLKNFLSTIDKNFKDCFVVGGILRDLFIYKNLFKTKNQLDIDIAVKNLSVEKLKEIILKNSLPFVVLDEENLVFRTVIKETNFFINLDFTNYENLQEDIQRRDFTINTLYLKLSHFIRFLSSFNTKILFSNLEDPLNAKKDIKDKVLKVVKEDVFLKDPLRIIRVARFYVLGFKPHKKINLLIKKTKVFLKQVAKERILEEIKKIFNNESYKVLEWMDKNGILEEIFPDIKIIKEKGKNTQFKKFYFHPEGLWQHVKLTYRSIEKILLNIKKYYPCHHKEIFSAIRGKEYILKFISLLHDIAKPLVAKKIKGKVRFFHHEIKSYEISEKILRELKLSNDDISVILNVIKHHMRIGNLCVNKDNLTQRAYLRLFKDVGDNIYFLLVFSLADRISYESIPVKERRKYFKNFSSLKEFINFENKILDIYKDYKAKLTLPKLLNGYDIMNIFKIPQGPLVGKLLNLIKEAQILGKISTRKQAISLIQKFLKNYKNS